MICVHIKRSGAAILLIALAVLHAGKADAADESTAITYCVDNVRNNNQAAFHNPYMAQFDAYYDPSVGFIKMFGSKRDFFEFEKCMLQQGWPLTETQPH